MGTAPLDQLRERLQAEGWTCRAGHTCDLEASRSGIALAIEVSALSSNGWDPLRGGLADAILKSRRMAASRPGAIPVAVVAAPRISSRMTDRLAAYRDAHAPDVSWGVVDDDGRIELHGAVELKVAPSRPPRGSEERRVNIWTDLGQWLLKVLVLKTVAPDEMSDIPSIHGLSNTELVRAIGVPGMSFRPASTSAVWQLTAQLRRDGFLDKDHRILRVAELLQAWRHRQVRPRVHAMSWLLPGGSPRQRLLPLLGSGRACLAGYTACHERKIAIVPQGVFEIHARSLDLATQHGLVPAGPGEKPDVLVRVPSTPEAVFRAVTQTADDGAEAADLIQCWLDLVDEPGRGREQADVIWRDRFHLP